MAAGKQRVCCGWSRVVAPGGGGEVSSSTRCRILKNTVLVAAAGAVVLCFARLSTVMGAAPASVEDCTYAGSHTAANPCAVDLYVGQHMTFECASGHTEEPSGVKSGGKYCDQPLTDAGTCPASSVKTLPAAVGKAASGGGKVTVGLHQQYANTFSEPISYNARCTNAGAKIFVSVKLWPFRKPMTQKPSLTCVNDSDTYTNANLANQIFCEYYAFNGDDAVVDCRESGQTGNFVPANAHSTVGNVCTEGFAQQNVPACLNNRTGTWGTVAAGATATSSNSSQTTTIKTAAMTVDRAIVYIGCKRTGGNTMISKGVISNAAFAAVDAKYLPMIKHVCTPEKGKDIAAPCDVTLAADEAVAIVCTPFVPASGYKMMPADSGKPDGSFCSAMPKTFTETCSDTKKWKDVAYTSVVTDPSMDFFIVALPKANYDKLKSKVTAYGYCTDGTDGNAWKITVGKDSAGGGPGGAGSAAPPSYPGAVGIAAVSLIGASLLGAAIM